LTRMKWYLRNALHPALIGLLCLGCTMRAALPGDEMSSSVTMASEPVARLRVRTHGCCDARPEPRDAPVGSRGIPVGPWTIPPDLIGPVYNGGVLTGRAPYRDLDAIRSRKGKVVLYLARKKSQDEYGTISVEAVRRFLGSWPDISSYIRDGTVWGIIVSDDITGKHIWGPDAPYYPQIDSIAQLVKERWPEVRTIVRAPPTNMNYPWKWVSWAWAQYSNAPRNGEVTSFRDRQIAKADSLGLCLAFGLNVVNGGDGSSGVGSGRRHQMTAAEVLKYYSALLPYTPVAFYWEYRPELEADPQFRAAMETVRSWADTLPPPSCRYDRAG
jgi:hypothetical protein